MQVVKYKSVKDHLCSVMARPFHVAVVLIENEMKRVDGARQSAWSTTIKGTTSIFDALHGTRLRRCLLLLLHPWLWLWCLGRLQGSQSRIRRHASLLRQTLRLWPEDVMSVWIDTEKLLIHGDNLVLHALVVVDGMSGVFHFRSHTLNLLAAVVVRSLEICNILNS